MKATIKKKYSCPLNSPVNSPFDIRETYDITTCLNLIEELYLVSRYVNDDFKSYCDTARYMATKIIQIKRAVLREEDPAEATLLRAQFDREENRRRRREHESSMRKLPVKIFTVSSQSKHGKTAREVIDMAMNYE